MLRHWRASKFPENRENNRELTGNRSSGHFDEIPRLHQPKTLLKPDPAKRPCLMAEVTPKPSQTQRFFRKIFASIFKSLPLKQLIILWLFHYSGFFQSHPSSG